LSEPFQRSDGWLLTTLWAAQEPVNRGRLNSIGDMFNHAIFNDDEVVGGMRRLTIAGYAYTTDDRLYGATEAGKAFVRAHWRDDAGMISNMLRMMDVMGGKDSGD